MLLISPRLSSGRGTGDAQTPHRAAVHTRESGEQSIPSKSPTTLVVEDTPIHLMLIERALRKTGVKAILRTPSGEEALQLLRRARDDTSVRPDLILLDLQLPGVSGFHLLVTIKSLPSLRGIPVVVLSCSDSESDIARCMAAGAEAFVAKPEDYQRFRQAIIEIVDFWRQLAGSAGRA